MPTARSVAPFIPWIVVAATVAQQPAGLLTGVPVTGVTQTTVVMAVGGEVIGRIPAESYRGIGEFVPPTSHRIRGVVVHLLDSSTSSAETFDLHVYLEQGNSNLPTVQGPDAPGTTAVASVTGLTTPAGIAVHEIPVVFPTPVDVPDGSDLFVGVVPQSPGLRVRAVGGSSLPGFVSGSFDSCGAALGLGDTYVLFHGGGTLTEFTTGVIGWQPMVDLLVDGSSGVAVAQTNPQFPPTASMFSGLYPDARTPSNQTARHDVPGYLFRGNGALPPFSPVFLLASIEEFARAPWIVLQPGNAVMHLPPINLVGLRMATTDSLGNALLMWPVPQSPSVNGAIVRSQAFGFDVGAGSIHAGAAVCQRF